MKEAIRKANKELEEMFKKMVCISDSKTDLNDESANNSSYMEDELAFCIEHIKMPLIAPVSYRRAFLLDPAKAIELMGQYLESTLKLNKNDRLYPIKSFLEQEWAGKIFKNGLNNFVEKVMPIILKYGLLDEMSECGINILATSVEGVGKDRYLIILKSNSIKKYEIGTDILGNKTDLVDKSEDRRTNASAIEKSVYHENLAKIFS
jgi:hypothetical protein